MKGGMMLAAAIVAAAAADCHLTAQTVDALDAGAFQLTLGVVDYDLRDQVLNPLAQRGRLAALGLTYEQEGDGSTHRFDVDLAATPLRSRFEDETRSLATDLRLAYRSAWEVAAVGRGFDLLVGGVFDITSHLAYFGSWDDSHFYWLTAYGLGPAGMVAYRLANRHDVTLEARVPIVSLVSRPEALIDYKVVNLDAGWVVKKLHDGIGVRSLDEHLAVDLVLRYRRPPGHRIRGLFWQTMYMQNDQADSAPLTALRHTLGMALGL